MKLFYKRDYELALKVMGAMAEEIVMLRSANEILEKGQNDLAKANIELQKENIRLQKALEK